MSTSSLESRTSSSSRTLGARPVRNGIRPGDLVGIVASPSPGALVNPRFPSAWIDGRAYIFAPGTGVAGAFVEGGRHYVEFSVPGGVIVDVSPRTAPTPTTFATAPTRDGGRLEFGPSLDRGVPPSVIARLRVSGGPGGLTKALAMANEKRGAKIR